jgi:hypothetical protein
LFCGILDSMIEEDQPKKVKSTRKRKEGSDYINNKELSLALASYVQSVKTARATGLEDPVVTDYIALGIYQIASGLSRSPNFMNYSYRDDMVMDAVENCIKVVNNFNIDAPTRTGTPNAFSYFTQISYYAFLRRIEKEKKQTEIKQKLIEGSSLESFADFGDDSGQIGESMIERARHKLDGAFYKDDLCSVKDHEPLPTKKKRGRPAKKTPELGPLSDFFAAL